MINLPQLLTRCLPPPHSAPPRIFCGLQSCHPVMYSCCFKLNLRISHVNLVCHLLLQFFHFILQTKRGIFYHPRMRIGNNFGQV